MGRAKHERREKGDLEDYDNVFYLCHFLTKKIEDIVVWVRQSRRGFVSRVLETYKRRSLSVNRLIG